MENVNDRLKHEDNMSDASYRIKRDSHEPILNGAFKGALASGIVGRILKPKSRIAEAGIVGAGTIIGGAIGQKDHEHKIRLKRRAKSELDLEKKSEADVEDARSLATDTAMGTAIGGLGGLMTAPKRVSNKKWALISAGIGGAGSLLGGLVEKGVTKANHETGDKIKENNGLALTMGAGMAADGLASPYMNKYVGRMRKNRNDDSLRRGLKSEIAQHERGKGLFNGVAKKIGWLKDERSMLEGMSHGGTTGKFFNKTIRNRALKSAGIKGLIGATIGYGLGHLTSGNKDEKVGSSRN